MITMRSMQGIVVPTLHGGQKSYSERLTRSWLPTYVPSSLNKASPMMADEWCILKSGMLRGNRKTFM